MIENVYLSSREDYPYLREFLGTCFLPGLAGEWSVPGSVAEFKRWAHPAAILGTRADVMRFAHDHGNDSDKAFSEYLTQWVDPRGFGQTPIEWLTGIEALLAED